MDLKGYTYFRLKNISAIASGICFQRAIQFLISACLAGLSFITFSQWSAVTLHGVRRFFRALNVSSAPLTCLHFAEVFYTVNA